MQAPLITVGIPAYNRPQELGDLLLSVVAQESASFEILVVEDASPRQAEILAVVEQVSQSHRGVRIRCSCNETNLGYDGNIRRILELAEGKFTLFMGDDDLLHPGALQRVAEVIGMYENLGVILRAYDRVNLETNRTEEVFRYFNEDRHFPAGLSTIQTFFRRSVAIAGYTVHTASARTVTTDRFDGTLLYQLHLSAQVLGKREGYFISDVLSSMRKDDRQRHFFGTSKTERGRFSPGALTPEHSLNFMRGMLDIARFAESALKMPVYDRIVQDIANYSYAVLRLHAGRASVFIPYARQLGRMGLASNGLFWVYCFALLVFPVALLDKAVILAKRILGATPSFGRLYQGNPVER